MGFCENLVEGINYTNYVGDVIHKLQNTSNKIYIFGAGDRAQWLGKLLLNKGIEFEGFLVNNRYYSHFHKIKVMEKDNRVFPFENADLQGCILLLGLPKSKTNMKMFDDKGIDEVITINVGIRDDYIFDKSTLIEHTNEINSLYDSLSDDFSKRCLEYCLRGRLTGKDYEFELSQWNDPEYFFDEFMDWKNCKCIIDCGAYTGDTIEEFKRKRPDYCTDDYKIYAFEPERNAYIKLQNIYADDKRIFPINAATHSFDGEIGFNIGDGELSAINLRGGVAVECRTIDSVAENQKIDFIKMDVEGSELESLKGASKRIKEDLPVLAICLYHKQEDLWTIPQFVKSLSNEYKLFIRPHSSIPTELVLFATH